jgi:RimJ/RimL family protein N-acetyltransferase
MTAILDSVDIGTVAECVAALRTTPLRGHVVDLLPYSGEHHDTVIGMRNTDRASYYLHQPAPLVRDGQARWFAQYLTKTDDLQWVIARKDGVIVGATALYDIAADRSRGEKGRLVVDDERAREAPYILEAELLLLDVAFNTLQLASVTTCVRDDNAVMQSINARFGFVRNGQHDIRGVEYFDYVLTPDRYTSDALRQTAMAWARRSSRTTGVSV